MRDDDIFAFGAPAQPIPPVAPPVRRQARRRVWPWLLLAAAVSTLVLAVAGAAALLDVLGAAAEGVRISIDGQPWTPLRADPDLGPWRVLVVAAALLALLVVLPVVLMLVLLSVALAVGLALLAVVGALVLTAGCVFAILALVLSPLWAALFVLWLLLRPRRKAGLASTAPGAV